MKSFLFASYLLFTSIVCLSQTDSTVLKNFGKTPLKDCQVYSKSPNAIKCEDTSQLVYSYEFDEKGRIIKKMKHNYGISDYSYLTTYVYDKEDKLITTINYNQYPNQKNILDTTLTEYFYNKRGRLISKIVYSVENKQKIENFAKMEYIYTPFDSIEKFIIYEYWPQKGYDTAYIESYSYNLQNLKSEIIERDIAGHWENNFGEGVTKFKYNDNNKLVEVNHFAKAGKNNQIDFPENNYHLFYRYRYNNDSTVYKTCSQYSYFSKEKTVRNDKHKLKSRYKGEIRFSFDFSSANNNYIPDIESEFEEIRNEETQYYYDTFGRILSIKTFYSLEYRQSKQKWNNRQYSTEFVYKRDGYFIIPEEEFDNDHY